MAYTSIDDPTIHFNTKLWTGNGSTGTGQTGIGFQPDWIWIKARAGTQGGQSHNLFDSVRGEGKYLFSDSNDAESTDTNRLTSFDSDGFTVGSNNAVNASSTTYVAWNWKAGGSASSNSNGSITSSVSANTTAGFSIVSWTGTGSAATIGHGLGAVPTMIWVKNRDQTDDWYIYSVHNGNTHSIILNSNGAKVGAYTDNWNNTTPTSSVFSVGGSHATSGGSSEKMIAYCFTDIKSYSKFGSYTGNGDADGTFVYTGFRPAFIITKSASSAEHWYLNDSKRSLNGSDKKLFPNLNSAESDEVNSDILSNGFKLRANNAIHNSSGQTYIYLAFAEAPFVNSSGIPCNAR